MKVRFPHRQEKGLPVRAHRTQGRSRANATHATHTPRRCLLCPLPMGIRCFSGFARPKEMGEGACRTPTTCPKDRSCTGTVPSGYPAIDRTCGGCDARALWRMGVCTSEEEAKGLLNSMIDPMWEMFKRTQPDCPRERAGVDDVEWAFELVKKAVVSRGFHFKKVQSLVEGAKELSDMDLDAMLKEGGSFLIDGYINQPHYFRGGKKLQLRIASECDRRHSTAVVSYEVMDDPRWILGGRMSAKNLWLNRRSQPNRKKGFMRDILRAYKIYKCCMPVGTECRGACVTPRPFQVQGKGKNHE